MLGSFKSRGFIYSCAILFNKLIPSALFRFGVMDVYELCPQEPKSNGGNKPALFNFVHDKAQRRDLKQATRNSLPDKVTNSHLAISIRDSQTEQLIGGFWIAEDSFDELDLKFQIRFASDQAWIYCAYLDKDHRRRGHYSSALNFAASEFPIASGRIRLLAAFNPFNKASSKAHRKHATARIGRIYSVCFFRKAICFSSGNVQQKGIFGSPNHPVVFECR